MEALPRQVKDGGKEKGNCRKSAVMQMLSLVLPRPGRDGVSWFSIFESIPMRGDARKNAMQVC